MADLPLPVRARPGSRAACSVGPDLAFASQLFQGEPDRLVADAWHCRPDVSEGECSGRVTQYVLADALLLGSRSPGGCPECRLRAAADF